MKILIIEDENRAALRLQKLIHTIDANIEIVNILDSIDNSVLWLKNNPHPDLILLDIHLSDGLSFNIFKRIKVDCPVIFTTAYDQYALKAFEINSIDYLLKPIDINKLRVSIDKYHNIKTAYSRDFSKLLSGLSLNRKTYKSRFVVNKGDTLLFFNVADIAYFYSEDKVTFMVTKDDNRYWVDESLDSLNMKLDPKYFFRINRQIIISIDAIGKIHNYFNYKLKLDIKPANSKLNTVISKARVKDFKIWLGK